MKTEIAANEQAPKSNLFVEETEDIKREQTESSLDRDGAVPETNSFENLGEKTTLVPDLGLGEEKKILRESDEGFRAADGSIPGPKQKRRELSFLVVSAVKIYKTKLPPINWVVPGILPEGISILAGPPKLGKSNLAFHMAQAVACGGLALSTIKVNKGKVLYLALEDSMGRIQTKLHASGYANDGLVFPTDEDGRLWRDVPKIGEGLEGMLQEWVDANPDTRMIVIDTYQKVKPQKAKSYEDEYRMIGSLKALADKNHIAILLVHHTRKKQGNGMGTDFLETLMGSQAIPGAADTILVMDRRRIQNQILLWITGRDVEERPLSITFDFERMLFKLDCDTVAATLTGEKKNIVDVFSRAGTPMRPKEIAEATGSKPSTVRVTLSRMVDEGLLSVVESGPSKGCYQLSFGDAGISKMGLRDTDFSQVNCDGDYSDYMPAEKFRKDGLDTGGDGLDSKADHMGPIIIESDSTLEGNIAVAATDDVFSNIDVSLPESGSTPTGPEMADSAFEQLFGSPDSNGMF